MKRAVVLLSGGLDSATVLAMAVRDSFKCHALSFDYGQRHRAELHAAALVATVQGALLHRAILPRITGSALTGDGPVPKDRNEATMASTIPVTYVPARNTIFLSHALALAEALDAHDIFIGANVVDYSGYPDCRPEFIEAFQAAARLGSRLTDLTIHAPLVRMTKAEIIHAGVALGVDYSKTWSCYDPVERGVDWVRESVACGRCDSCTIRRRGFVEAGVADPTRYA